MMQSTLQSRDGMHVAIIMDGNGRWATRRGLPRPAGHRAGANAVRRAIEAAPDLGITTLTLFAFSCDNWRRPPDEVSELMWLLKAYLRSEARRFIEGRPRRSVRGRFAWPRAWRCRPGISSTRTSFRRARRRNLPNSS